MSSIFKMAQRNIWRNKRRTLITIASIFFALFFAIIMRSFQLGTYGHMIHQSIEMFSGYLQIQHPDFLDDPSLDNSFELDSQLMDLLKAEPEIKIVVPRIESFSLASSGLQSKGVLVTGIDPIAEAKMSNPEHRLIKYRLSPELSEQIKQHIVLNAKQTELLNVYLNNSFSTLSGMSLNLNLDNKQSEQLASLLKNYGKVAGSYLSENDKGVLLSDRLSKYLKITVGDTLILMGQGFHGSSAAGLFPVRGIVKIPAPDLDNKLVYMTLTQAQQYFSLTNRVTSLAINLNNNKNMKSVQQQLSNKIDKENYTVKNWEEFNPTMKQQIEGDSVGGQIFVAILYLIVFFGIFGTVLMMVSERKREFGVMVAIGMPKKKLAIVVVFEMLFIGFFATLAGMLVSAPILYFGHVNPVQLTGELAKMYEDMGFDSVMPLALFDAYFFWQGFIILIMVLLACYIPLRSIRKMKVMQALRA